jgi:hypothetical protein
MPTRIVFAAPGVKDGVLTQVFEEEPADVLAAIDDGKGSAVCLTARTRRKEAVYVNPSTIAYWTEFTPHRRE